jgi:hypothetical protein
MWTVTDPSMPRFKQTGIVTVDSKPRRRSGRSLLLAVVVAVLFVLVIAGVAVLVPRDNRPADPLTDQQSKAQVVEPAKEIVAAAQLRGIAGSYILMSCRNQTDPPYQGSVYVTFELPDANGFFDQVAAVLVSQGWRETPQEYNHKPGTTVSKDGVTAVLYRDPDRRGSGIMKVYGECRNLTDHRNDPTGWVDISDELR